MSTNPFVRYWLVEGNSGVEWKVSQRRDGTFACACPKWKFHKAPKADCHHITYVKTELQIDASIGSKIVASRELRPTPAQVRRISNLVNSKPAAVAVDIETIDPYAVPSELLTKPVLDRPIRKFRADLE